MQADTHRRERAGTPPGRTWMETEALSPQSTCWELRPQASDGDRIPDLLNSAYPKANWQTRPVAVPILSRTLCKLADRVPSEGLSEDGVPGAGPRKSSFIEKLLNCSWRQDSSTWIVPCRQTRPDRHPLPRPAGPSAATRNKPSSGQTHTRTDGSWCDSPCNSHRDQRGSGGVGSVGRMGRGPKGEGGGLGGVEHVQEGQPAAKGGQELRVDRAGGDLVLEPVAHRAEEAALLA